MRNISKSLKNFIQLLSLLFFTASLFAQPTDEQVVSDAVKNKDGLVDVYCTTEGSGELFWHSGENAWYWDRGVVVKRKTTISGAPDAVVVVKGLARYNVSGGTYSYKKFLTTSNEYEGIPTPSADEMLSFVNSNLKKVFYGREHSVTEVSSVAVNPGPWTWHEATRFSVKFDIKYKQVISYTEVAEMEGVFDIMLYRKDINSAVNNLLSVETSYKEIGKQKYSEKQIKSMKTLADK